MVYTVLLVASKDKDKLLELARKGQIMNLDRKLSILRGFIPRNLCVDKRFALKLPRELASGFLGIIPALSNRKFRVG
jgi:hypothetical protein